MFLDELYRNYKNIEERLVDDKSKELYDSRVEYMITKDVDKLEERLLDKNKEYSCFEIDKYLNDGSKKVVLFGTGKCALKTIRNLGLCNKYNIVAFCDNDIKKVDSTFCGLPVWSYEELIKNKDCFVIICTRLYGKEIYNQLLSSEYNEKLLYHPVLGYPEIQCDWQYFDVFKPREGEVFLDAGSYNGNSSIDFWKWSNKISERKAICLEPVKEMYNIMVNNLKREDVDCITYNCAAWKEDLPLNIMLDTKIDGTIWGGSRINDKGYPVLGKKIDTISKAVGEITFIKMDIEGSEIAALQGARKTIEQYKPRLAISLYHKPSDVIEIPLCIMEMNDDYKFIIRHYSGSTNETVLYAYI